MINWPIHGNDYGAGVQRLIGTDRDRQQFLQESLWHSQNFARFIQTHLGRRYGLAENIFPHPSPLTAHLCGGGAYALHPYFRESRRLRGLTTVRERDILPIAHGRVAALPITVWAQGCERVETACDAIAIGNYANDHHYPSGDIQLAPKSLRWGGRWTGTPFTIPYRALIPVATDGFLACEKNISVSHIANGATRLQPLVLGIGQAAGLAAALCIEHNCQPRDLDVRSLQEALLSDPIAPAAVIPLFNCTPDQSDWQAQQRRYLDCPEAYPANGYSIVLASAARKASSDPVRNTASFPRSQLRLDGIFRRSAEQDYHIELEDPAGLGDRDRWKLVTLQADIDQQLQTLEDGSAIRATGRINTAGGWLLVESIVA